MGTRPNPPKYTINGCAETHTHLHGKGCGGNCNCYAFGDWYGPDECVPADMEIPPQAIFNGSKVQAEFTFTIEHPTRADTTVDGTWMKQETGTLTIFNGENPVFLTRSWDTVKVEPKDA